MSHGDWLGWSAAALMVATFACRDARRMRCLAVCTNLAFIGYAATAILPPVMALHLLLLPINLWRWHETRRVVPRPHAFENDDPLPEPMAFRGLPPATTIRRLT